jgi:peptide/nickel transport system substrate-binding protein
VGGAALAVLQPGARADADEKVLTVGTSLDIKTLDPGRTNENAVNSVNHVAYDTLVTFQGEDLKTIRPRLATRWTVSPDGRTYTFTLRPNLRFATGNPLTSADVKWAFDRLIAINGPGAFTLSGVDAVEAPDPLTVVLRLKDPKPAMLAILTDPVLSPLDTKLVMAHGGDASSTTRPRRGSTRIPRAAAHTS